MQLYRKIAIAISRRDLQKIDTFDYDEEDEEDMFNADRPEQIHDVQAGHVSWIAGNIYSRGIIEISGVVASMRERVYRASREWHRWLGLDVDRLDVRVGTKRKSRVAATETIGLSVSTVRVKRLRRMDIVGRLKAILGAEAEFRGCQQAAIQSIMQGENCIVQVMGTGGGKSLSFMLPAWYSTSRISVVVVPLVALRADMMDRCQRLKILYAEWDSQRP